MKSNRRKDDRGSALVLAVVLVMVLGIGAAAVFRHLHSGLEESRNMERDLKTLHLAEAGIDKAVSLLRAGAPLPAEPLEMVLGDGIIRVSIAPADKAGVYTIRSRAELRDAVILRAWNTYEAEVCQLPDGRVKRLSWHREKKQS